MKSTTLQYILNTRFGYAMNAWIPLPDISMITTGQDASIYIDNNQQRYRFGTTNNLLEISYGKVVEGNFISRHGETSNYTADAYKNFEELMSFLCTVQPGPFGNYYQKYWPKF